MKIQINTKIQILLALIAGGTATFLQAPSSQFQLTFNSTFLPENGKLYRPIVIPNLTEHSDHLYPSKANSQKVKTKDNEILKKILQTDLSRDTTQENNSAEEVKPSENRFSSRYSSKEETPAKADSEDAQEEKVTSITDIPKLLERNEPISSKISLPSPPNPKLFSDRSDRADDSEEEKINGHQYPISSEAREREESEIASTTNEPYSELRTPTSIRTSPDEHFENYETSSGVSDESDEEESEERSFDDYHNSGSKNYHSIQTPLNKIKYRGPHSFGGEYEPERTTSDRLRLIKHNWPYTREQLKSDLEENEISDEDENERLESEEWTSELEPRTPTTKAEELELAIHKDENRFNRNRTHSHLDDRKRRKQQEKNLAKEEEKDSRSPFYKTLPQYVVNEEEEEEPKYQPPVKFVKIPKKKPATAQLTKKPKNIFSTTVKPNKSTTKEITLDFPVHQFLGPVVFDKDNSKIQTTARPYPKITKPYKLPHYVKDLEQREKLDQDNLITQRFQKAVFGNKDGKYQSFNHLEESNEMYSAILANIQSVFGLRTQPLKTGGERRNHPEVNFEESSALTWSVPVIKRHKAYQGVLESATLKGSDSKVKSASEGAPVHRKSLFPTDITQPRGQ